MPFFTATLPDTNVEGLLFSATLFITILLDPDAVIICPEPEKSLSLTILFEPARVTAVLPLAQFVKLFPPITQLLQPLFKDIWLLPASVLIVLFKNFICRFVKFDY